MTKLNEQIQEIISLLELRLNPQAVKMIERPEDIPAEALIAAKEYGHLAYCQAQALTKRDGKTVYMEKKDHWCWGPLVGFGLVDCSPSTPAFKEITRFLGIADINAAKEFFSHFPMLPYGKYIGTVVGPAQSVSYDPDVVLISCDNNFQLRTLLWAIKYKTGKMLDVSLDPIDSCIHTIVTSMLTGEYSVAIPDPGDQERALSDKNEIILSVPAEKVSELHEGLKAVCGMKVGYKDMQYFMKYDYERPPFYNRIFELWGLETGRDWDRGDGDRE